MKIINSIKQAYCKNLIKDNFLYFFKENEIKNTLEKYPLIEDINIEEWGFTATVNISGICSYSDLENKLDYLKQLFRAVEIIISNKRGKVKIEVVLEDPGDIEYYPFITKNTSLILGYDFKGSPILIDMLKTPHVGVQGLSVVGKSKMVESALLNLIDADIALVNCFQKDFTEITGTRINGTEEILNYLTEIKDNKEYRERPLYIVIDELNVLGNDKKINSVIADLLSQARHFNIYVIALGQTLLKENCPYKNLFNVRITFKTIDKSMISAFLGCTIENTELQQREFIVYSDSIKRGKTYLIV